MFFVVKLADGFGRILESGVIQINDDLGNNGSNLATRAFLCKGVMDSLGKPVTDLALAHGDGGFEGHGGGFVGGGVFFVEHDVANLGTITVSDDNFVFIGKSCYNSTNDVGDFFLSFGGDFAVFLKGVAAKC